MRKFEVVTEYENQNIEIPVRATKASAGYDFAVAKDTVIKAGEITKVPTGIKACFPKDEFLMLVARSSLPIKKTLMLPNGVGIIDADYYGNEINEGHILVLLYNFGKTDILLKKGEKIAQGVFICYQKTKENANFKLRTGGFGSSDS